MKRFILLFALVALLPALALALPQNAKRPLPTYPMMNGNEIAPAANIGPVAPEAPSMDEVDLVGDTTTLGMTWYENQHNGTCGRMNTLESTGWRQFAWMKGENSGASVRHVWWNGIDPNGAQVFPGNGVAVESAARGGFVNMDIYSNGAALPAYHNSLGVPSAPPQTAVSADLIPHSGAFLDFQAPATPIPQIIWPRMQVGQNGRLHIVSTESPTSGVAGAPQRQYYIGATYNPATMSMTYDPSWTFMDWTMTIAADVATSPVAGSNKTLWAWTRSRAFGSTVNPDTTYTQLDNDLYYLIDADGLNPNFSQKVNLTTFIAPQLQYLPDTLKADRDTLRVYTDLGTFIDNNNYAHIVFTTRSYFSLEGTTYWNASLIWHWSEQYPDTFRVVGGEEYFGYNNNVDCGVWNVKAQRPTLAQAANGNLYCMYQVYDTDTTHLTASPNFMPSGEIYVSVSTDGGMHWSRGLNVTSTITPNQAPLGASWSELTPTMAKKVDSYVHIEYVLDKDAGNVIQTEGGWTNNPVRYHRVPTASIPTTPLVVQTKSLHTYIVQSTPSLDVTLTPINPPIVIPANGGQFQFVVGVTRTQGPQAPFYGWTRIKNPNGSFTPSLGPIQLNPPVGTQISRTRTQNVPSTWAAGLYTYQGYVALNPNVYPAIDSASFTFTKSATADGGPLVWEASCTGEPFPYEVTASTPQAFTLEGAYPNPFNPATTISFNLPEASHVNLTVYDVNGRELITLVDGQREAGQHQVTFDGSNLSSGVYFYTLTAGSHVATGKMALVK